MSEPDSKQPEAEIDPIACAISVALAGVLDGDGACELVESAVRVLGTGDGDIEASQRLVDAVGRNLDAAPASPNRLARMLHTGTLTLDANGSLNPANPADAATSMLETLEPRARAMVAMRMITGADYGQLARVIGESEQAVAATLTGAFATLGGAVSPGEKTASRCGQEQLISRYLDNELREPEREAFESHSSQCQSCQQAVGSGAAIRSALERGLGKLVPQRLLDAIGARSAQAAVGPGTTIAGYRIVRQLGQGGMGTVYKAVQLSVDRTVAFKVLAPRLAADPDQVERFVREAKAAARLDHPNVVRTIDAGEADGVIYHVMEYVSGQSVRERIQERPFEVDEALRMVRGVANALVHAAKHGIVHRDIKPANIMLTGDDSQPKLADLGLARLVHQDDNFGHTLTATGEVMGTPAYMPPEQIRDTRSADHRSDIYALGVSLYQMVSGKLPFTGSSPLDVVTQALNNEITPPENVALSDDVLALLLRMTRPDPAQRYQDAREVISDIDAILAGLTPAHAPRLQDAPTGRVASDAEHQSAPPTMAGPTTSLPASNRGHSMGFWAGVTVAAVVATALIVGWYFGTREREKIEISGVQIAMQQDRERTETTLSPAGPAVANPADLVAGLTEASAGQTARRPLATEAVDPATQIAAATTIENSAAEEAEASAVLQPAQPDPWADYLREQADTLFAGEVKILSGRRVAVTYDFEADEDDDLAEDFVLEDTLPRGDQGAFLSEAFSAIDPLNGTPLQHAPAWSYFDDGTHRPGLLARGVKLLEWQAEGINVEVVIEATPLLNHNLLVTLWDDNSENTVMCVRRFKALAVPEGAGWSGVAKSLAALPETHDLLLLASEEAPLVTLAHDLRPELRPERPTTLRCTFAWERGGEMLAIAMRGDSHPPLTTSYTPELRLGAGSPGIAASWSASIVHRLTITATISEAWLKTAAQERKAAKQQKPEGTFNRRLEDELERETGSDR